MKGYSGMLRKPGASDHQDDPDVETVLQQVRDSKTAYLRWGRETLGWSIYVFKKGLHSTFPVV